jgi:cell division protein FtsL
MTARSPEPTHFDSFKWRGFFLFLLMLVLLAGLLGSVYLKHHIRMLEAQYYQIMQQTLVAKEQWGRLQLEKNHLTSPQRVENIAKNVLDMQRVDSPLVTIFVDKAVESAFVEFKTPLNNQEAWGVTDE